MRDYPTKRDCLIPEHIPYLHQATGVIVRVNRVDQVVLLPTQEQLGPFRPWDVDDTVAAIRDKALADEHPEWLHAAWAWKELCTAEDGLGGEEDNTYGWVWH